MVHSRLEIRGQRDRRICKSGRYYIYYGVCYLVCDYRKREEVCYLKLSNTGSREIPDVVKLTATTEREVGEARCGVY